MVETLTREINTLTEEVGSVGIARREAVRLKEFDSWEVKFGLREKRVEKEKNLMTWPGKKFSEDIKALYR